jgi:hypothetical protein
VSELKAAAAASCQVEIRMNERERKAGCVFGRRKNISKEKLLHNIIIVIDIETFSFSLDKKFLHHVSFTNSFALHSSIHAP